MTTVCFFGRRDGPWDSCSSAPADDRSQQNTSVEDLAHCQLLCSLQPGGSCRLWTSESTTMLAYTSLGSFRFSYCAGLGQEPKCTFLVSSQGMLVRVGWGHALETDCRIKEYHNILSNYQSTAVRWYHCPILYSRGSKAQIHSGLVQLKL